MELKPTRLKIKSMNSDRTGHALVALDQYFIEGVRNAHVEINGGELAVVKLEIYLKDIDLEIPGLPEELPFFAEPAEVEQLAEILKELDDGKSLDAWKEKLEDGEWQSGPTVINITFLEAMVKEWRRRIECKEAAAALQVTQYGKITLKHGADNVRDCATDLEELINSKSGTLSVP